MKQSTTGITVAIVDDHQLLREGLAALLSSHFAIVGSGATSGDARRLAEALRPDVIVLDVELGGDPAETTIRAIRRESPSTAVVVLTMFEDAILRRQLLNAGASDFLAKTIDHTELARRLVAAASGNRPAEAPLSPSEPALLSPREQDVLRLIAAAASNRDIALALSISEGTVKRHTTNLYAKLGALSRIDAVRKAVRHGLLS